MNRADPTGPWYHGSDRELTVLREGSTVTQWRQLAEAFSHKPAALTWDGDGRISHNGTAEGILYRIGEEVTVGRDLVPHPRSSMEEGAEFITCRPLRLLRLGDTGSGIPQGDGLVLAEPAEEHLTQIRTLRQEIMAADGASSDRFAGCSSLDRCASAEEWVALCRLRQSPLTCQQTGAAVPSHTYLALRRSDALAVGIIDLRHHIDHPVLGTWGGHCGYTVRPTQRGRGYAPQMLILLKERARALGLPRLLVTCAVGNLPSERTILRAGGLYEKTLTVDGKGIKRYWIEL